MKLTEVAIDGYGVFSGVNLCRFSDRLNFIYGENGAGKTTFCNFLRGLLFGFQPSDPHLESFRVTGVGRVQVHTGKGEFRLERDFFDDRRNSDLRIEEVTSSHGVSGRLSDLVGPLHLNLFDTVYSFSLRKTSENARRMATLLHQILAVPRGPSAAGDDDAYKAWQTELNSRESQLASLRQSVQSREADRLRLRNEIDESENNRLIRLADLERQIASADNCFTESELAAKREELVSVEQDIERLRSLIDSAVNSVTYVPRAPEVDPCAALYQRLDELDHQIRRWRRVQTDIQNQRVRLKDEMVVWNELTLDSNEHPYHHAQEILVSLERKVDEAEKESAKLTRTSDASQTPDQIVRTMQSLCREMRDDLYGLCEELAHQYKHIRHKAAAAELKQLRRCYNEMGENTDRLVQRRDALVQEIRKLDPAGADAIERSDIGFCQCAMHEGYLEARRRHVSAPLQYAQPRVSHQIVSPDLTTERKRLDSLLRERQDLISFLNGAESEMESVRIRYANLIRERDAICLKPAYREIESQIRSHDSEIVRLNHEIADLVAWIEQEKACRPTAPHPVIVAGSTLLARTTEGELAQVFLDDASDFGDLLVRDRIGKVLNFSTLHREQQDVVYLCLVFAIQDELKRQGTRCPTIIDDAFVNFPRDRVNAFIELYKDRVAESNQLILLTQHQYLADRVPGAPVFELPPIGMPSPLIKPDRAPQPVVPQRDGCSPSATSGVHFECQDAGTQFSTYPISKYTNRGVDYRDSFSQSEFNRHSGYDDRSSRLSRCEPHFVPVGADSVGDPLDLTTSICDSTTLDRTDLFDIRQLRILNDCGIDSVAQLLGLDLENLPAAIRNAGISIEQFDRWQAEIWLLSNVPGLRVIDARLLVACGITEPDQLATSHPQQMFERIQRFLGSSEGKRFASTVNSISLQRVNGWYQALNTTRYRWSGGRRSRRSDGYRSYDRDRDYGWRQSHDSDRNSRGPRPRTERVHSIRSHDSIAREPRPARPPRMKTPDRSSAPALTPIKSKANKRSQESGAGKLRFYLDLSDHIEAAPSIGPKTAERFEKIGVATVAEFLKHTAESMATKLKYKRITADLVRAWQHQARLVCRIPNLRGHDAQLLVACGYTEAEEVATMQPQALLDVIGPFADTKEGLKIIRSGKKPDLAEITDWINWAGKTRSLQAA